MVSTTVSNIFETPHHNTMAVLASERSLAASARTLLGVLNCNIEATEEVEEAWASRTVKYTITPTKTRLSPIVPQGLPEAITVTVSAQLPSSVVATFQLEQGRCLRLEAHVLPETYSTSRLTITAHHNFAVWAATGPFIRYVATTAHISTSTHAGHRCLRAVVQIVSMLFVLQGYAGDCFRRVEGPSREETCQAPARNQPFP